MDFGHQHTAGNGGSGSSNGPVIPAAALPDLHNRRLDYDFDYGFDRGVPSDAVADGSAGAAKPLLRGTTSPPADVNHHKPSEHRLGPALAGAGKTDGGGEASWNSHHHSPSQQADLLRHSSEAAPSDAAANGSLSNRTSHGESDGKSGNEVEGERGGARGLGREMGASAAVVAGSDRHEQGTAAAYGLEQQGRTAAGARADDAEAILHGRSGGIGGGEQQDGLRERAVGDGSSASGAGVELGGNGTRSQDIGVGGTQPVVGSRLGGIDDVGVGREDGLRAEPGKGGEGRKETEEDARVAEAEEDGNREGSEDGVDDPILTSVGSDTSATLSSSLRRGGPQREGPEKHVRWPDDHGFVLTAVKEYEPSESSDDYDDDRSDRGGHGCSCVLL